MLRAVLFDLDNTLFDRAAAFRRYASGLLQRRVPPRQHAAVLAKLIACDDGNQHREFAIYAAHITQHVAELGMSAEEYCADYVPGLLAAIEPDERTRDGLLRLGRRFKLGLITNGGSERQREKLRRLGLSGCFAAESVLISGEVGVAKPDAAIFHRGIAAMGCAAEEIVFCGDDPERDIAGAAATKMKTCWIRGLRAARTFPESLPRPDWQIERIEELQQFLEWQCQRGT